MVVTALDSGKTISHSTDNCIRKKLAGEQQCFAVFILQMMEMGTAQSDTPGHFQISFWGAIGACIILMVLGMFAGLAPAYRAMAIKPIEAIRDE